MTSNWQAVLIRCRYEPRFIPILLAILRICSCFWPQYGYLHPDEFFQSSDIVVGNHLKSIVKPCWEFTNDRPIRFMLFPYLLNTSALRVLQLFYKNPSAYLLLVAPRLAYTLLSFSVDFSLYKLCQYYSSRGLWYLPISIIFQSSFICLSCLTRTFSNVPEVVIFSLLLVVVCQAIRPRFRILFVTPAGRRTPVNECVKGSTQLVSSVLMGFLITLGTFNRPTFPCFAIVPSMYWFSESLKRNSYKAGLTLRRVIVPAAFSALITSILSSTFDTIYYKGLDPLKNLFDHLVELDLAALYDELKSNWIFTTYNFIVYNTNTDNLISHGFNPPYMHLLVNLPLAFNVLALMFFMKLIDLMIGSGVYRLLFSAHRIHAMMILTILTSTTLLSFIPHQEFRFLLPLIVPLVYAFGFNIYTNNRLLSVWIIFNITLIYFYGRVHQAGVIRASLDLDPILRSHTSGPKQDSQEVFNVIALRCYFAPTYLWNIYQNDKRFYIDVQDDFTGEFNRSALTKLSPVIGRLDKYPTLTHKLYVMLPTLYEQRFDDFIRERNLFVSNLLKPIKRYSPHFSGEEIGLSLDCIRREGLKGFSRAFGFSLIELAISKQEDLEDI